MASVFSSSCVLSSRAPRPPRCFDVPPVQLLIVSELSITVCVCVLKYDKKLSNVGNVSCKVLMNTFGKKRKIERGNKETEGLRRIQTREKNREEMKTEQLPYAGQQTVKWSWKAALQEVKDGRTYARL